MFEPRRLPWLAVAILILGALTLTACGDIVERIEEPTAVQATAAAQSDAVASPTPASAFVKLKPTDTPPPLPPTPPPRPTNTPAPTPGAAEAQPTEETVPALDITNVMVEIPAGPFTLGNNNGEANEGPVQEMDLPAFMMDAYEVTNSDFEAFIEATGYQTYREKEGSAQNWRWAFTEGKENNPVVFVTFDDAQAFCEWAAKRLPTEFEWEKAARGPDAFLFPWGNEYDPAMLNGKDSGQRRTLPVGSFPANPHGLFDMAGNVKEWVSSPYQAYPGSNYQDPFYSPDNRGIRGGGWFDEEAFVTTANRNSGAPAITANDDIGFRCAAEVVETPTPEPTATEAPAEPSPEPSPAAPAFDITGVMLEIPAGVFILGSDEGEANEGPAQEMDLPAFRIDAYEVTNSDFEAFIEATGYQTYREKEGSAQNWRWAFTEGKENNPVVFVTFDDAQAFCEWAAKRLPTEFEWEKAARGPEDFLFPWGNEYNPAMLNGKDSGQRRTLPVGSFPANPHGLFDMAGNVKEWVDSPYQAYPGSDYQDPFYSPDNRGIRGGGWFDEDVFVRAVNRNGGAPTITANDDIGFRCAK